MSIFAGKTLMITGGTGSFGNAVLNRFLKTDIAEIRIFSRDEKMICVMSIRQNALSTQARLSSLLVTFAIFSRARTQCQVLTTSSMQLH